jgi:hypothetical protein
MESLGSVYLLSSNIAWKKNSPFHTPHTQGKKEAPSLHGTTSHYLHGNSIPKIGYHYFWPWLVALPMNTLSIEWKEEKICQKHIYNKSEVVWRTCWGNIWELKGNIVRTRWKPRKNEKKSFPAPTKLKMKKSKAPWMHALGLPSDCMKFLFPKEFGTILSRT